MEKERTSKICCKFQLKNTPRGYRQRAKFHFFSFLFLSVYSSTGEPTELPGTSL